MAGPGRFNSAAGHYLAGRPAYAPRLIRLVAELTRLSRSWRVLDLGCGPGPLARAFAPLVAVVVAIDPEPEMLLVARGQDNPGNITWIAGSSETIGPAMGRFDLVTMGRSFHWMDRAATLRQLDGMIAPGGAIALFHDTHPDVPANGWYREYREIIRRYSADDAEGRRVMTGFGRHEGYLLDSAFCVLEEVAVIEPREVSAGMLVDRALSMSSVARAHGEGRAAQMAADIRALVGDEIRTEVVGTAALIARRG